MLKYRRIITFLLLSLFAITAWAQPDANSLYQQALSNYADGHYREATDTMRQVIKMAPENSDYQHLLGICYGRLAETANPLFAPALAEKTRKALEKAVQLDGNNVSALRDLMEYYRQAPWFLGGSKKKADKIEKQLQDMHMSAG